MAFLRFQFRRDLSNTWSTINPVLAQGELGLETDSTKFKLGDGTTEWNNLSYVGIQGPQGIPGIDGSDGSDGVGVVQGGTTGQALVKASDDDYDTTWSTVTTTPAGSDTQVQFNDGGAFGGDSGLVFNKTAKSLTLGGATVTASSPVLNLSQTWNSGATTFTGLLFNATDTASAAASLLLDLQVGGTSFVSASKAGDLISRRMFAFTTPQGILAADGFGFGTTKAAGLYGTYSSAQLGLAVGSKFYLGNKNNALEVESGVSIGWSSSPGGGHTSGILLGDLYLARDAAGILAQRRGTNAQESRVYGTFTDGSNHRRVAIGMSTAGVGFIRPEGAGTGATGNVLHISGLPTSNPGSDILWNDGGTVAVGVRQSVDSTPSISPFLLIGA
jgi:hypothetical protein